MKIVKTRRAGNSTVVTIPPGMGYEPGVEVLVERMADGTLRITPASRLHEVLRGIASDVVHDHSEAFAILEEHDRQADRPAAGAA